MPAPPAFGGDGSQSCSARQAEPIAPVLRSAWAGRPTAAASAEELVVRLCGSAEATAAVLGARRAGGSTASPCSEHLVRLSRKSQEREGSCTDKGNIEAHWLDWATSQKANPLKPTAAQSISGDEATENDSQKYGEGGSRLRPKWDAMTQHGKDFPNRVGNTTTQRMSLKAVPTFCSKSLLKGSWITPVNKLRRTANHSRLLETKRKRLIQKQQQSFREFFETKQLENMRCTDPASRRSRNAKTSLKANPKKNFHEVST